MNFVLRHWRGQLSVSKAVWLSGFIAWLVVLPIGYLEFRDFLAANGAGGISDLIDRAQNGDVAALNGPSRTLEALDLLLNSIMFVWWSVGTWRSCDNPVHKAGKNYWFLKLTIIVMAAADLYDVYEFIGN